MFIQKKLSASFNYDFCLNLEKVELVEKYVYLGTIISFNGELKGTIEKQIMQANGAFLLYSLRRKSTTYPQI